MKRQGGQALLEALLVLPLLAGLLWGFVFLARAFQARMNLLDLTREFAVFAARSEARSVQRPALQAMAARLGMDPGAVDYRITPGLPGAQRLRVEYRFAGMRMREELAFKMGLWKHPTQSFMEKLWIR